MKARFEFNSDEAYSAYLKVYFAAMAMQGIVSNPGAANSIYKTIPLEGGELLAKASLVAADALLKALEE